MIILKTGLFRISRESLRNIFFLLEVVTWIHVHSDNNIQTQRVNNVIALSDNSIHRIL